MYRLPPYEVRPVEYNTRSISDIKDWGHQLVNPDLFWEQGFKGEEVVVFVIDTGIDDFHPDLKGKVIHRKDFTNESPTNYDVDGHGTWCASRISANENKEGVIGIAPDCVLADLRVINVEGFAETEWIAEALIHMMDVDLGRFNSYRRVASMSLGGPSSTPALKSAVKYVFNKGGIIIAAAGNAGHLTGKNTMSFPAKYEDHVIAVGALDPDGKVAKYSSIGEELDVTAPGTDVLGAFRGDYAYLSGTSMATPHIAGVVALLISKYGDLITSKNIEAYLQENAKDLLEPGWDILSGFGSVVMSKLNEGPRVEIPINEDEEDQEIPKGCALPSSVITLIEKTKAMYGRGKHIWDNWGKKDKPPYKESLSTKEVRTVKEFLQSNKHKMRKQEEQRGFAEIVDTLTDAIQAEVKAQNIFQGKFDAIKAVTWALQEYPTIKEAVEDWPVFEAEIKDLFVDEGVQVMTQVEANLSAEEKEKSRLLRVARFASAGYANTVTIIELGKQQLALGADIFA